MIDVTPILRNVTLLLALVFVYSLFLPLLRRLPSWLFELITGTIFGLFTILTMLDPIRLIGGGQIDARHVIVMVAAIVVGWRGGVVAAIISSAFRIYIGGIGMIPGVMSILTAFLIGWIYHYWRNGSLRFDWSVLVPALLIPIAPLSWVLTMAGGVGFQNFPTAAPPVMITYPLASIGLLWLLSTTLQRLDLMDTVWQFEQRQDVLFQQTPTILIGITPQGQVININPAGENLFELSRTGLLGEGIRKQFEQLPPRMQAKMRECFQLATTGILTSHTITIERDDTRTIDVQFIPIVDQRGRVTLVLLQGHDITSQLRVKEQALALSFQRERTDLLQQLIADASHHLRTPLSVISSSIYLLRKQLENITITPEIEANLERHLIKLKKAQNDLDSIVSDLLDLMRLDDVGAHTFNRMDLVPLLRELTDNYQSVATDKGLTLHADLSSVPLYAVVAGLPFKRLIENLLENAMRYTPSGGEVTVRLKADTDGISISVSDTGIGISDEDQKRIFDRFYRAQNGIQQNKLGTGLGLAIVRKTVDMHQGDIMLDSAIGEGTTFTVTIPQVLVSASAAG